MTYATRLLALAALPGLVSGCSTLTDLGPGIAAIEVIAPFPAVVAVGDSVQLSARALSQDGETVPAELSWVTPDTTIAVDSATGVVTGITTGTGRVQALSGSLSSAMITLTVIVPPATPEALRRAR